MNELKGRGVQDIVIALIDGLTGFPAAIHAVFPQTQIHRCVVHLVRQSLQHANWKERKALAAQLRAIYQAPSEALAAQALVDFAASPWAARYPLIARCGTGTGSASRPRCRTPWSSWGARASDTRPCSTSGSCLGTASPVAPSRAHAQKN